MLTERAVPVEIGTLKERPWWSVVVKTVSRVETLGTAITCK